MKFLNKSAISFAVILLLMLPLFAAETNYDETAVGVDYAGVLLYKGTITFSDSGSGDAYYTQGMYTGGSNVANGLLYAICSEVGTEDVNVLTEYSFDGETWITGETMANLDALGTTAVVDTVGVEAGTVSALFDVAPYTRLKFVAGQAINATTVTWALMLKKDAGLETQRLRKSVDTQ